jgi:hypothetical protein
LKSNTAKNENPIICHNTLKQNRISKTTQKKSFREFHSKNKIRFSCKKNRIFPQLITWSITY